ncbi:type IV secretory system conjugative DNA transfer family protein [Rhodococcus qingshengii]|uniref:type IV secretory system conjugative DNA transfer family protein n=1 Tax=Rhodococcus qingshengii TaxID=334542 RepID=UPI001C6024C4|nr:type IV secretory system conjugative DNA transfer family protein [Rhodococcus qingshengii]MBW4816121.1 type IV secretory system conjugative DNA transfer family protein [Rhodococcus qingshengii]
MLELLVTLSILSPPLFWGLFDMRAKSQDQYDADRTSHQLVFPTNVTEKQVQAVIRSIGSNLRDNKFTGDPSIVFEVHSSERGIQHLLRVPSRDAEYLLDQVEGHLPGIDIVPVEKAVQPSYNHGVRLFMTNPERTLRFDNTADYSTKILKSLLTTGSETVTLQWIAYHSDRPKLIESDQGLAKSKPSLFDVVVRGTKATKDEVADRREKVNDQIFTVVGRIAASAATEARAKELVLKVTRAITSENGAANRLYSKPIPLGKLNPMVHGAVTPFNKGNMFSASELVAYLGWPVGDPQIQGLSQGVARRIPPTEAVSRVGRQIGWSNIPGINRPIAQSYDYANLNTLFAGMIGSGKSVGMSNSFHDDVSNGYGAIVIDASASESPQSLANRALDSIPKWRADDVIRVHVLADADHPVGFDPINQGAGRGAIDQITGVFTSLYPDIATGVSVRDLLHHGLWTIIDHGGLNLIDLGVLIRPQTSAEVAWADAIIKKITDPDLREFWKRMEKIGRGGPKQTEWDRYVDPLYRRLWQLVGRPEIRNMIGQSSNSLNWEEILTQNKIVVISLAGLPKDSAELLGSLLVETLWTTAQRLSPERGNALYLDEFQVTANIKNGLDDLLNRGRKHNLWVTLGTQFISELPKKTKTAIFNNVGTRIIYRTSYEEAHMWRQEFGSELLSDYDFQHARVHEAIAQIPDSSGRSIVTIKARPPQEPTGAASYIASRSRARYGRPVEEVRKEIAARRTPAKVQPQTTKPVGKGVYDVPDEPGDQS